MQAAAVLSALGFVVIAVFQAALALGAPLGRAAWGGAYERLPARLRVASAAATGIWLVAALVVMARAGSPVVPMPSEVARWGTWILVGILSLGAIVNVASSSPWERWGWAPVSLVLAALCLLLALSGP